MTTSSMVPEKVLRHLNTLDPHPTYIHDLPALQQHARRVKQAMGKVEVVYAAKANPDPQILQTLHSILDGFEVASGGELQHVGGLFPDARLSFGAPAKRPCDLQLALETGVKRLHVESPRELQHLARLSREQGKGAHILLRANLNLSLPDVSLQMGGQPSPFGMDEDLLTSCLPVLKAHPEVVCHGIHVHLASGLRDAGQHAHLLQEAIRWFERFVRAHHLPWTELNLGGGMGVNYQDPGWTYRWETLGEALSSFRHLQLRIEPGRSLSASCGYYACPILDIKKSHGETFVLVQGGTHHFRTPAAQGHSHPFQVHRLHPAEIENTRVHVVGQLCTPKDRLSTHGQVEGAAVGDWVVFPLAGAYSWNISHTGFLMHPEPHFAYLPVQDKAPV